MSSVNTNPPNPDTKTDIFSINRTAQNSVDRRMALDALLTGVWNGVDVGRLERVDTANTHAWKMWLWQPDDGE